MKKFNIIFRNKKSVIPKSPHKNNSINNIDYDNEWNIKWAVEMVNELKIIFRNKKYEIPEVPSKKNLVNAIYYDTEWWNKKWALEWWTRNGHFNEDLYRNILLAKLDSIDKLSDKK